MENEDRRILIECLTEAAKALRVLNKEVKEHALTIIEQKEKIDDLTKRLQKAENYIRNEKLWSLVTSR